MKYLSLFIFIISFNTHSQDLSIVDETLTPLHFLSDESKEKAIRNVKDQITYAYETKSDKELLRRKKEILEFNIKYNQKLNNRLENTALQLNLCNDFIDEREEEIFLKFDSSGRPTSSAMHSYYNDFIKQLSHLEKDRVYLTRKFNELSNKLTNCKNIIKSNLGNTSHLKMQIQRCDNDPRSKTRRDSAYNQ